MEHEMVQLALKVATEAHKSIGQKRKYTGEDYITHPMAVKEIVASVTDDPDMLAAALLHDVIEDVYPKNKMYSPWFISEMFGDRVGMLVDELTNQFTKENYPKLNRKARKQKEDERISKVSNDAKTIKLADIIHTCSEAQSGGNDGFRQKYVQEKRAQLKHLESGNQILLERAWKILVE